MEIVYVCMALIAGFLVGYSILKANYKREKKEYEQQLSELEKQKSNIINQLDKEKAILEDRYENLQELFNKLKTDLIQERDKVYTGQSALIRLEAENKNLLENIEKQQSEVDNLRKKFIIEFENIGNKILKSHSQEFTELNVKNIGEVLKPLKEKIGDFEKKVNEAYDKELRDKISLREEVKKLFELNSRISQEANNLTKALKGDSKKQGNWGEIVLERVLERSGLIKGQEYDIQVSSTNEDGKRLQPDVVIYLPDKKHIIVDSKVSLVAYDKYVSANTDEERQQFINEHVLSIRNHIKKLGEKNYQTAVGFNSPDFVLLFIPIESSFGIAVQTDQQIFNDAWDNRIVIVSPSTLLATLKTISSIWKQENQTKNAIEIARQSGALYDKFVGFISDIKKIGESITKTQTSYNDALNKLSSGSGNLISRVENIRKLGAKTSKSIPDDFNNNEKLNFPEI